METRVIGLCGPIGCGKSTIARRLNKAIPDSAVMSFADGVRDVMRLAYDIPASKWKKPEFKNNPSDRFNGSTPRRGLQLVGTEGFRAFYPDTWVDYLHRRIERSHYSVIIVDDVRFLNEADWIKRVGGDLIYVQSKTHHDIHLESSAYYRLINRIINGLKFSRVHASESNFSRLLDVADYVIENNWRVDLQDVTDKVEQRKYLAGVTKHLLNYLYSH